MAMTVKPATAEAFGQPASPLTLAAAAALIGRPITGAVACRWRPKGMGFRPTRGLPGLGPRHVVAGLA